MIRALYSAASGMTAQQMNVDNIANNLANANTTGYKMRRTQFQDLHVPERDAARHGRGRADNGPDGAPGGSGNASRRRMRSSLRRAVLRRPATRWTW